MKINKHRFFGIILKEGKHWAQKFRVAIILILFVHNPEVINVEHKVLEIVEIKLVGDKSKIVL